MSKKISNKSIPVLTNYHDWVVKRKELSKDTANNYCTWLKNIPEDIELSANDKYYDYLRIIGSLILCGDRVTALSVADKMFGKLKEFVKNHDSSTTLSNDLSALNSYRDCLFNGINYYDLSDCKNNCTGEIYESDDQALAKMRKGLAKKDCCAIDSMRSLLSAIDEKEFIRMAIGSSYFFDPKLVEDRFNTLANLSSDDPIPSRWSTNETVYTAVRFTDPTEREFQCGTYCQKVLIDGGTKGQRKRHENYHVDQLIVQRTGYTLKGNNPSLQNYIISHIWGNAIDPRYYTNLWNIAIVPAWANFLLDKNAPKGSVSSKFKATMMCISKNLYEMDKFVWGKLKMAPPVIENEEDIIHGTYNLNYINEKANMNFGLITVSSIEI